MDQSTRNELREVAAALEEDLGQALKEPYKAPDQIEMRLRALEAALTVALNALINSK